MYNVGIDHVSAPVGLGDDGEEVVSKGVILVRVVDDHRFLFEQLVDHLVVGDLGRSVVDVDHGVQFNVLSGVRPGLLAIPGRGRGH